MSVQEKTSTAVAPANTLFELPRLGIGLLYNPSLPDFLRDNLDSWDYVEIIPDMFWNDEGGGQEPRYRELDSWVKMLEWLLQHHPVVAHNLGLSLGSAEIFDTLYLQQLCEWHSRYKFAWHSDHLSFVKIKTAGGHEHNAGLAIPVPYDREVLNLIVDRIKQVQDKISSTFLIENNVHYIDIPDQDMSEAEFLNQLFHQTGCGLLLDLHNLYVNARNHSFRAKDFLTQLDLSNVIEIHIAGGSELGGMYTDSHAGPCPEPVWDLLEFVVPRTRNLCGITFEFHESYYPLLKEEGILSHLNRARKVWDRFRMERK